MAGQLCAGLLSTINMYHVYSCEIGREVFHACRGRWDKPPSEGGPAPLKVTIHRSSLLQDGWAALHRAGSAIKGRLMVSFVNEQGMLEAGLDYGGLVREFLQQVTDIVMATNVGLEVLQVQVVVCFRMRRACWKMGDRNSGDTQWW